jgi:hypothetical protein
LFQDFVGYEVGAAGAAGERDGFLCPAIIVLARQSPYSPLLWRFLV